MSRNEVVKFEDRHVAGAARLFAARYRAAREVQSVLPGRFVDPGIVEPRIRKLAENREFMKPV